MLDRNPPMAKSVSTTSESSKVAFLGFCERAHYIRDGKTNYFKWNVLGLRNIILSHIFPFMFNGWTVGIAFLSSQAGKEMKFRLVGDDGKEVGTLTLSYEVATSESDETDPQRAAPLLLIPEYGWSITFLQLAKTGWVITKPGIYYLEQLFDDSTIRIGTVQFVLVDPIPLSPERIAAIKAEPNAANAVKLELGCKHCPSKYRVYASLVRNQKLEEEGWNWYQNSPNRFDCECSKTMIDLQYIQRNLHGLLGHRRRDSDQISFMPMYEKSSLESIRTTFSQLVSRKPREESLQQFIYENPILLHQFPAERIIPKPPILTSYVADIGIVTPQKELILIELEKTTTRLMKKDGGIAAPLSHAFNQVQNWLYDVNEHRLAVLDALDINRDDVSVVKGVVIAGRDSGYDARNLRKLKGTDWGRVIFLTYDDLLFSLDALIRRVEVL